MAIRYNKQVITKDRRIQPSGPRDRQMKQRMQHQMTTDHSELIEELRNQIHTLQNKLAETPSGGFSAEQVNDEIVKAIKEETARLNKRHDEDQTALKALDHKYKIKIKKLEEDLHEATTQVKLYEKDIEVLKEKISEKDELIEELKSREPAADNNVTALLAEATKKIEALSMQVSANSESTEVVDPDRPQMEVKFVDPIEKESEVEKHFEVEVEDVSINKKAEMGNKVDKLKSLLGKLPTKR